MNKSGGNQRKIVLRKEEIFKAVIIADQYEEKYAPVVEGNDQSIAVWTIGNVPIIRICLFSLYVHSKIQNIIVISKSIKRINEIKEIVQQDFFLSNILKIEYVTLPCSSSCVGDCLRELYSKQLIDSDFVLFDRICISTVDFQCLGSRFKLQQRTNKHLVGAACFTRQPTFDYSHSTTGNFSVLPRSSDEVPRSVKHSKQDELFSVIVDTGKADRIVMYRRGQDDLQFLKPDLFDQPEYHCQHHNDFIDAHAFIGTEHLLSLFADNFDYMTLDDLIKGLLVDEEISEDSISSFVLNEDTRARSTTNGRHWYHIAISNMDRYLQANFDFVQSRFSPIEHNMFTDSKLRMSAECKLLHSERNHGVLANLSPFDISGSLLVPDGCLFGSDCSLNNVIFGSYCTLGNHVCLRDCVLWDNVTIGDNCKGSSIILMNNVTIGCNVDMTDHCVITSGVTVPADTTMRKNSVLVKSVPVKPLATVSYDHMDRTVTDCYLYVKFTENELNGFDLWGEAIRHSTDDTGEESSSTATINTDDGDGRRRKNGDGRQRNTLLTNQQPQGRTGEYNLKSSESSEDEDYLSRESVADEVFGTVRRCIDEHLDWQKVVLELNCLKHAYNIPIRDLIEHIVDSVLRLPLETSSNDEIHNGHDDSSDDMETAEPTFDPYSNRLRKMFPCFEQFVKNYAKDEDTQVHVIYAMESTALKYEQVASSSLHIHRMFYDGDLIEEPAIMRYYRNPLLKVVSDEARQNLVADKIDHLRQRVEPFLHWLETADEEESDDSNDGKD